GARRPPRDRHALPSRGALAQGARDSEGGGFLESTQPARWNRCVGGERGSGVAAVLIESETRLRHGRGAACCAPTSVFRMPKGGLEPPRACAHWLLKPARLPIPPLRRGVRNGESKARYNPKSTLGLTASTAVSILPWLEWTKSQSPATRGRDMTTTSWRLGRPASCSRERKSSRCEPARPAWERRTRTSATARCGSRE